MRPETVAAFRRYEQAQIEQAQQARAEEEARLVREALHCVEVDSAGHWPTVAGVLAAEVERLQVELARLHELRDAAISWRADGDEWGREERLMAAIVAVEGGA